MSTPFNIIDRVTACWGPASREADAVKSLVDALQAMLAIEDSVTMGQERERRAVAVPMARDALDIAGVKP